MRKEDKLFDGGLVTVCARCSGYGIDPDPDPVCCDSPTANGCCFDPVPAFGPCIDCNGAGMCEQPRTKRRGEWIECSDNLPDRPSKKVVVEFSPWYAPAFISIAKYSRTGGWVCLESGVSFINGTVVRWTELPKPITEQLAQRP